MPLARILTRFPEHAGALSQELRHRGYTVEFSNPELAGKAPADLEIDFEICAEPDALSRASELAEQLHADVAVSPGVVQHHEHGATEPVANAAGEALSPAATQVPEREMIAGDGPVREEPLAAAPAPAGRVVMEVAGPAVRSGTAAEKASRMAARAGGKSAAALQAAAVAAGELWASAGHWAQEFWASARQRSREYSGRFEARRAEMRADRQHKLLELKKRRALAQERAAELETAREAAAARLQELLRERGGLTEAQPAPPQKMTAATAANSPGEAGVLSRGTFADKARLPFARVYRPQVEAVLVGVAAACLLFVVGLAVASFHARPALSTSLNQPSHGATVQSGGVTVKAGAAAAPVAQPVKAQPAAARTQAAQKAAPADRQRSAESDVTVRHFPTAAKPSPGRGGSSRHVADDVVIRHFGAQVQPPAQTAPRAELKRYSDLDN